MALVEREDFAAGTSSRSTKLVHGERHVLSASGSAACFGILLPCSTWESSAGFALEVKLFVLVDSYLVLNFALKALSALTVAKRTCRRSAVPGKGFQEPRLWPAEASV